MLVWFLIDVARVLLKDQDDCSILKLVITVFESTILS